MKKNRGIAIALAIIFGGFGVHKFYLRDPGAGVFYIILNIVTLRMIGFGAATLLGWFDAFKLLSMGQRDFDRKYNWDHMRKSYSDVTQHKPSSRRQKTIEQRRTRQRTRHVSPRNNPYKKSGIKKFKDYDLKGAIEDFEKAVSMSPTDGDLHFNLACAYSLNEETEKSLDHLAKAVANGFKNIEMIHGHDALAYVRIQPAFDRFVDNNYKFSGSAKPVEGETKTDHLPQLEKLKELREKGLISELEYIKEKQKLTK